VFDMVSLWDSLTADHQPAEIRQGAFWFKRQAETASQRNQPTQRVGVNFPLLHPI
jgi:hypothetical protein